MIMGKYILGIDPGKNGGIAVMRNGRLIFCEKMPATPLDILTFFSAYQGNAVAYLEKVGGMPGQGGQAMFTFGQGYGWLEMALLSSAISTTTVTPQKWQKFYQIGTAKSCKTKSAWKNKLKAKAQQVFPTVENITLATADAILIANYGSSMESRK